MTFQLLLRRRTCLAAAFLGVLASLPIPAAFAQDRLAITNLGLAAQWADEWEIEATLSDHWFVFAVNEQGADLNGDGDAEDWSVLHVLDFESGDVTNVGLAGLFDYESSVSGSRVVFSVTERMQGRQDLNGDGDAEDWVVHVADLETGEITKLGLVALYPQLSGRWVVASVRECSSSLNPCQEGEDLNGDGDVRDSALHIWDLESGEVTNLGLAALWEKHLSDHWLVFRVSESKQGHQDLNGDGDTGEYVLHVHDLATGQTVNLGLAYHPYSLDLEGDALVFGVSEQSQGGEDLNGDGDAEDIVFHFHDLKGGETINLGASSGAIEDGRLTYLVGEPFRGRDLNGDGDTRDAVIEVRDLDTGNTANLGLAATADRLWRADLHVAGDGLSFTVSERGQGSEDLNHDGDDEDNVLHFHNLRSGVTTNLGLAAAVADPPFSLLWWPRGGLSEKWLVFEVSESQQAGQDLNGDGDAEDLVLHIRDLEGGKTTNLGLAAWDAHLSGRWLAFRVSEWDHGHQDLNGDGDAEDSRRVDGETPAILFVRDLESARTWNLGVAAGPVFGPTWNRVVFPLGERHQGGRDLNGDGDARDAIFHLADLSSLQDLPSFVRGDCNDDGEVDISDAVCTLSWLFLGQPEPSCKAVTNVDGVGDVDITDPIYLLTHLFLGAPSPVMPFPECGPGTLATDEETCESQPKNCR